MQSVRYKFRRLHKFHLRWFEPDDEDDWKSDEAIFKSNPNLNISVGLDYIKARVKEASDKPHLQIDVKTKNLNIWTQSASVWINTEIWQHGNIQIDYNTLNGEHCYIGLDLATTRDIAAYSVCFIQEDQYILLQRFLCLVKIFGSDLERKKCRMNYGHSKAI